MKNQLPERGLIHKLNESRSMTSGNPQSLRYYPEISHDYRFKTQCQSESVVPFNAHSKDFQLQSGRGPVILSLLLGVITTSYLFIQTS